MIVKCLKMEVIVKCLTYLTLTSDLVGGYIIHQNSTVEMIVKAKGSLLDVTGFYINLMNDGLKVLIVKLKFVL